MRQSARSFLVVATLAVAFAAWPGAASATLTVTGATIDGKANSTSSPSGSVLPAKVTGSATDGDTWRGTQYRFGSEAKTCANTSNTSGTDKTVDLNVTAPRQPGSYDAGFTSRTADDCDGERELGVRAQGRPPDHASPARTRTCPRGAGST